MRPILRFLFLCAAWLALTPYAAAAVTASVDRSRIGQDESFTLIIDTPAARSSDAPDLAALDADFDVLGTTQSSQIQIINGRTTSSRQWLITLAPKREGKLVIPALAFGKEKTKPIAIEVTKTSAKAQAQSDVLLEAEVDVTQPYVQQQVVLTVKLLHRVPLREGALSKPQIKDAVVERLGEDTAYETQRGTDTYRVIERRYAIFPQKSTEITISGLHFDGKVPDPRAQNRGGGLLGRGLFDDPFDLLQPTTAVRVRAPSISLQAKPIPAGAQASPWLPARQFTISESWSEKSPKFAVGQPITRTITLQAEGLTVSQLPSLEVPGLEFANIYPDHHSKQARADARGVVSESEQKLAIIPTQPGEFQLPEIRIPWWNVEKNRQEYAAVPARKISVTSAVTGDKSEHHHESEVEASIHDMEMEPVDFVGTSAGDPSDGTWRWIGIGALLAWLLTVALWLLDRRHRGSPENPRREQSAVDARAGALRNALRKACGANDAPVARSALLAWARERWPERPFNNLGDVAALAPDDTAKKAIVALDGALYAGKPVPWNGTDFAAKVEPMFAKKRGGVASEQALPPLYPTESSAA